MGDQNMFRKTSLAGIVGIIGLLGSLQSGMVRAGTGVTYQGQLKQSGAAFDGVVDLTFALYDVPSGGRRSERRRRPAFQSRAGFSPFS